jgi:hypothetical protein
MPFLRKTFLSFPAWNAKLISNYFDNKQCGSNKIFLLIACQIICAPNLWSVKRDAAQKRKKFVSSWFTLRILSASPLTQGTLMRHCIIVCNESLIVKVIANQYCWRERKRKYVLILNGTTCLKKMDIDIHGPRPMPNIFQFLDPPYFSLPTTFNRNFNVFVTFWCFALWHMGSRIHRFVAVLLKCLILSFNTSLSTMLFRF